MRNAIDAPIVASSELLDGLNSVKAGLALGTLVGDFAPLQDALIHAQGQCSRGTNTACVATNQVFVKK